ncbi:MAG: methionine--tRNA ligase [Thermoflexus sp.]|nr:methionine--tRNA ligase [Thermoflexus sp.]
MTEKVLVCVAWPYANGPLHLGHIAGAYLPADIFARYHRLKGNRVLMVSGSDSHGTPITVQADREGVPPRTLFERYHRIFLETWQKYGISFDLFTHTDTENHHRVAQDMFLRLLEKGYLFKQTQRQFYSEVSRRFLPDRYIEGTCPICGYERARGDQCEQCGVLLEATQLIHPRSRIDGSVPVLRETEHYFFNLPAFAESLLDYLRDKGYWRPNVLTFTLNYIRQGLQPRPITRDLDWGIPVPLEGFEGKVLYVWFEAVIGYLSATIEWASISGNPEAWKDWWYDPGAKIVYFIGKDNIPFHTIIWPAQLIGTERLYEEDPSKRLILPYDVPANEFLNLEGDKFSTSRNWAVWALDAAERYAVDAIRYYLTSIMPETQDAEFRWADFIRHNNEELLSIWGNLVHRVLTFAVRHFDGEVPMPGLMEPRDAELLARIDVSFGTVGRLIEGCRFRQALETLMGLAAEANRYLNECEPWREIHGDRTRAGTIIYVALRAIDSLKVLLAPFLPFSSQRVHEMLGYEGDLVGRLSVRSVKEAEREHLALVYEVDLRIRWEPSRLRPGQRLREIRPLFERIDEARAEEERARLGQPTT